MQRERERERETHQQETEGRDVKINIQRALLDDLFASLWVSLHISLGLFAYHQPSLCNRCVAQSRGHTLIGQCSLNIDFYVSILGLF